MTPEFASWDAKFPVFPLFPVFPPSMDVFMDRNSMEIPPWTRGWFIKGGFGNSALGCVGMIPEFALWDEIFPGFPLLSASFFPHPWMFLSMDFPPGICTKSFCLWNFLYPDISALGGFQSPWISVPGSRILWEFRKHQQTPSGIASRGFCGKAGMFQHD